MDGPTVFDGNYSTAAGRRGLCNKIASGNGFKTSRHDPHGYWLPAMHASRAAPELACRPIQFSARQGELGAGSPDVDGDSSPDEMPMNSRDHLPWNSLPSCELRFLGREAWVEREKRSRHFRMYEKRIPYRILSTMLTHPG